MCSIVTSDYAGAMRIPLLRGRFLTSQDNLASPTVVVIDEVLDALDDDDDVQNVFSNEDIPDDIMEKASYGPL